MKHLLLCCTIMLLAIFTVRGQSIFLRGEAAGVSASLSDYFSTHLLFKMDTERVFEQFKAQDKTGAFNASIALPGLPEFNTRLVESKMIADDFKLLGGGKADWTPNDIYTLRGEIEGQKQGKVTLTLAHNMIAGSIQLDDGRTFFIEPLRYLNRYATDKVVYVLYENSDILESKQPRACLAKEAQQYAKHEPKSTMMPCDPIVLEVGIANDYQMVEWLGSEADVIQHNMAIMNLVQTNYDDEFNYPLQLQVVSIFVSSCADCDPWSNTDDYQQLYIEFSDWLNQGGFGDASIDWAAIYTPREFTLLFSAYTLTGGLCNYYRTTLFSFYDVALCSKQKIAARALARSLGASNASSGIMSSGTVCTNDWHPNSIAQINNAIVTKPCLSGGDIGVAAFNFEDAQGNPKTAFCFGEDVYLDGTASQNENSYYIDAWRRPLGSTGAFDFVSGLGWTSGQQVGVINLMDAFAGVNYFFDPGYEYRIKLAITNGDCIPWTEVTHEFTLTCCDSGVSSAEFSLNLTDGMMGQGNSIFIYGFEDYANLNATHEWIVLSSNNINGCPYSVEYTTTNDGTDGFVLISDIVRPGQYYTVIHKVYTPCGESCFGQMIYVEGGLGVTVNDCQFCGALDCSASPLVGVAAFNFEDVQGNPKTEFCFGEDVYLDGTASQNENSYYIDAWRRPLGSTGAFDFVSGLGWTPGQQVGVINLMDAFAGVNYFFDPGYEYRIKLAITNGDCIPWTEVTHEFTLTCCDKEQPSADFSLNLLDEGFSNSLFVYGYEGYQTLNATHEWIVLSSSNPNGGPYTQEYTATTTGSDGFILFNLVQPGLYYTVIHKVRTLCGEVCFGQMVHVGGVVDGCEFCGAFDCSLYSNRCAAPANVRANQIFNGVRVSWDPVPGATGYLVRIMRNDHECCGNGTEPTLLNYATFQTSIRLNYNNGEFDCFSYQVATVCADGSITWSGKECFYYHRPGPGDQDQTGTAPTAPQGKVFPNPARDQVTVNFDAPFSGQASLVDALGRVMGTQEAEEAVSLDFDLSALPSGLYWIVVRNGDEVTTFKVTKQ